MNQSKNIDIGLAELANVYNLRTFRSSHFLLKVKTNISQLILKSKQEDGACKEIFFFVKHNSIPNDNLLPINWVGKGRILFNYGKGPIIHSS